MKLKFLLLLVCVTLAGCGVWPLKRGDEIGFQLPVWVFKDEYIIEPQLATSFAFCPWPEKACNMVLSGLEYEVISGKWTSVSLIKLKQLGIKTLPQQIPYDEKADLCLTDPEFQKEPCSPNYVLSFDTLPSDPMYGDLYGLHRIRANRAWRYGTGVGSWVFVVDTGIAEHIDLGVNLKREFSYNAISERTGIGAADDDNGHGTHVAGTISAMLNNAIGVVGVAPSSNIVAVKFLSANGSGSLFDAVKSVDYVTNFARSHNIKTPIINASWGGGGYSQPLHMALQRFEEAGGLFVVAAGNEGSNNDLYPRYPANYELKHSIVVAATDLNEKLASFSNFGRETVDIAAPGVSILSLRGRDQYIKLSGTSMATPHISGVAALISNKFPDAAAIRERVLKSCRKIKSFRKKIKCKGEVRAGRAVRASLNLTKGDIDYENIAVSPLDPIDWLRDP